MRTADGLGKPFPVHIQSHRQDEGQDQRGE